MTAQALGLTEINKGIAGTCLQNTVPTEANNFRDRYYSNLAGDNAGKIFIMGGINDCIRGRDYTAGNYKNDLAEIVAGVLTYGFTSNNIYIVSPPFVRESVWQELAAPYNNGSTAKYLDIRKACQDVARGNAKFIDIYTWMQNTGGLALLAFDGIHPNDTGHQAIANCVVTSVLTAA